MKFRILAGTLLASAVIAMFSFGAFSQQSQSDGAVDPKQAGQAGEIIRTGQTEHSFSAKVTKSYQGQYLLYLPEEYGRDNKSWPLILFLHGSGERIGGGKIHPNLSQVGLPKTLQKGGNFPFIVLTPQCPAGKWWSDPDISQMVIAMLDEVCKKYNVDERRIYLTGLSMGGFGTWSLAQQNPDRFAALVPVCGGGNMLLNDRLKKVPVWIFHGAKDKNVPIENAYKMGGSLKQMGGNVQLQVFPNQGHFIWDAVYTNPKLYEWLMQQQRPAARKKPQIKRVTSTDIKTTVKVTPAEAPTTQPVEK